MTTKSMSQATKNHLRQCCEPVNYKTVSTIFSSTTAQTPYCLDVDDDEPQLISSTRKTVFLKKAKTATGHVHPRAICKHSLPLDIQAGLWNYGYVPWQWCNLWTRCLRPIAEEPGRGHPSGTKIASRKIWHEALDVRSWSIGLSMHFAWQEMPGFN